MRHLSIVSLNLTFSPGKMLLVAILCGGRSWETAGFSSSVCPRAISWIAEINFVFAFDCQVRGLRCEDVANSSARPYMEET